MKELKQLIEQRIEHLTRKKVLANLARDYQELKPDDLYADEVIDDPNVYRVLEKIVRDMIDNSFEDIQDKVLTEEQDYEDYQKTLENTDYRGGD